MPYDVRIAQAEAAVTGESPVWDEHRGVLWWIDIQDKRLLGWRPAEGLPVPPVALPSEIGPWQSAATIASSSARRQPWRYVPETGASTCWTPVPHDAPTCASTIANLTAGPAVVRLDG